MAVDVGSIELYMGPKRLGAPDDLQDVIVQFIGNARDSLEIAVQELESKPTSRKRSSKHAGAA